MLTDPGWQTIVFPFYSSENQRGPGGAVLGDLSSWSTVEFYTDPERDAIDIGGNCVEEFGEVTIILKQRAGTGDALLRALEPLIVAHVRGWSGWPVGALVDPPSKPNTVDGDGKSKWQEWTIVVPYTYFENE